MSSAEDAGKYISYKLKPQLKTLGPKYGKKLGARRPAEHYYVGYNVHSPFEFAVYKLFVADGERAKVYG